MESCYEADKKYHRNLKSFYLLHISCIDAKEEFLLRAWKNGYDFNSNTIYVIIMLHAFNRLLQKIKKNRKINSLKS